MCGSCGVLGLQCMGIAEWGSSGVHELQFMRLQCFRVAVYGICCVCAERKGLRLVGVAMYKGGSVMDMKHVGVVV